MPDPSSATILLVDDNDANRSALTAVLCQAGFAVKEACNGTEALRLSRDSPDLVILDVCLPDINGFEVCHRIKSDPATASTLVLHLSGQLIRAEDRTYGLESGADSYLIKPIDPQELIAQVKALLRIGEAEEALKASESRLQAILDHSPVIVYLKDIEGRYLLVNHRWETLFHLRRDQVLGKTVYDVFPKERADVFRANDRQVLQTGGPLEFEEVAPHDDGPHTYLSVKFPLHDAGGQPYAVCGISTDFTGRKRAEQARADSEALYHALVENVPFSMFRKDRDGRFTFANQAFCAALKKPLNEVLGKTDLDFYPGELARKYILDDRTVAEMGQVLEDVEEHQDPDGARSYVQVLKAPVHDARGDIVGMQGLFWDITPRKQAEAELGRATAEFRIARQIQQRLFPAATPQVQGLDISSVSFGFDIGGASYPAEAVGGDYYDYIPLQDGSLGIAIGDVSGHGVGPALLMAEVRAYLRAFGQKEQDVGVILGMVNRILAPDVDGDRFITLLLARLDPRTRSFRYTSAGHQTGFIFDASGNVKAALKSTSMPLGILAETEFPTGDELQLETGDLVLFVTDGVVEARAPDGTSFGTQRVEDLVRVYRTATARQIVENIYHAVRAFSQNLPQYDDITATVIKVGPTTSSGPAGPSRAGA